MRAYKYRIIQESHHPCNNGYVGYVKYVPVIAKSVQGEKVGNAGADQPIQGIAKRSAHDEADRCRREAGLFGLGQPDGQSDHRNERESPKRQSPRHAFLLEKAIGYASVPDQNEIEKRGNGNGLSFGDASDIEHPPFVKLIDSKGYDRP